MDHSLQHPERQLQLVSEVPAQDHHQDRQGGRIQIMRDKDPNTEFRGHGKR